jgi:hypothetical protein
LHLGDLLALLCTYREQEQIISLIEQTLATALFSETHLTGIPDKHTLIYHE